MDDFEEIEGAADPAAPNSSTGPRNGTERNTNEVASMPTGTLCALALAVLDVSVAADTDKIIKAARDKLTAIEAQHPLTFHPLVSSSYPLRAITNEATGLLVVTLPAGADSFTRQIVSESFIICNLSLQDMSAGATWPLSTPIIHGVIDLYTALGPQSTIAIDFGIPGKMAKGMAWLASDATEARLDTMLEKYKREQPPEGKVRKPLRYIKRIHSNVVGGPTVTRIEFRAGNSSRVYGQIYEESRACVFVMGLDESYVGEFNAPELIALKSALGAIRIEAPRALRTCNHQGFKVVAYHNATAAKSGKAIISELIKLTAKGDRNIIKGLDDGDEPLDLSFYRTEKALAAAMGVTASLPSARDNGGVTIEMLNATVDSMGNKLAGQFGEVAASQVAAAETTRDMAAAIKAAQEQQSAQMKAAAEAHVAAQAAAAADGIARDAAMMKQLTGLMTAVTKMIAGPRAPDGQGAASGGGVAIQELDAMLEDDSPPRKERDSPPKKKKGGKQATLAFGSSSADKWCALPKLASRRPTKRSSPAWRTTSAVGRAPPATRISKLPTAGSCQCATTSTRTLISVERAARARRAPLHSRSSRSPSWPQSRAYVASVARAGARAFASIHDPF